MANFKTYILILSTFLLSYSAFADVIRQGTLQARSNSSVVVVSWTTDEEANVARFEIERRAGTSGDFGYIASVDPKGPSMYEFTDHSAYKSSATLYQYRIKVVFRDGSTPLIVGPVSVIHSVSGVRRTWGSIKAMFR